ncbi:MAG TPA: penicillin-binding transpeptidase domain-containing protein [Acidimicrobiales bacterium]|nr:penicillin-binding transpeptidase domain-containing protein [Acidimicrobiales bacterium]
MSWGPIDPDWGEGWEDFDIDPFAEEPRPHGRGGARPPRTATVHRLPRPRPGRRGVPLDRSLTAPRPTAPAPRHPPVARRAPRTHELPDPAWPAPTAAHTVHEVDTRHARPAHGGGGGGGRPPRQPASRPAARPERRSLALKALLAVLLLAVVGKLVHVQVLEPDRFVEVGQSQRLRTVQLEADRGRILDREGHDLALSVLRPTVFADPSQIEDPLATARRLAPVLGMEVSDLTDLLDGDNRFAYLSRRIDDDVAARVVELELDGVHLLEEPARFTPSEELARAIIGRVAPDQTGATGMELLYDEVLTGTPGEMTYERARDGGTIAAAGQSRVAPRAGSDVVLTLDRSLQYETERVLAEQVDALGAKGGTVIISQPESGEILALANITRNTDDEIITAGANRAVIDVFEPGSVNKVITIAAALEEGLVSPGTELVVPDSLQVSDHRFSDDHEHPTMPMTVTQILAESSNVGTIMLAQDLGKERIDQYLRSFGFGSKSALGFPNESPGLLLPTDSWSGTSIGSIPIGQGIAVTAMQMLDAYNVIANDGIHIPPRLVAATVDADGTRTPIESGEPRRVVSAETAQQVREMLVEVVDNGTGENAQVAGYSVGGKTGTARKPQDTGTYRDAAGNYHYVAAFTGMVPAEDPALSIIVAIDEPTATIYGGSAAAPVFADLAKFALNRFRIPPAGS